MKSHMKNIMLALGALLLVFQTILAKDVPMSALINPDGSVKPEATRLAGTAESISLVNELGEPIFTTVDDIEGMITHMVVLDGKLYVGGYFKKADRRVVNNVAVWDGTKWSGLGKGVDGKVKAMCAMGKDLVVAGDFSYVDKSDDKPGVEANRIARWDGKKWNTFAKLNIDREIFALAYDGKTLYIGGNFKKLEGKTDAASVAMWDGKGWKPVGGSKFDKTVLAMTCVGKKLYVGGFFTTIGDEPASNIAMWDGKAWSEVGKRGINNTVKSLANDGTNVYAGGGFSKAGDGTEMKGLGMWDGTKWSPVGGGIDAEVYSVNYIDGKVCVVGGFSKAGGKDTYQVGIWDGKEWSVVPEVTYAQFKTAIFYGGALHIGGSTSDTKDEKLKGNILKFSGSGYEGLAK